MFIKVRRLFGNMIGSIRGLGQCAHCRNHWNTVSMRGIPFVDAQVIRFAYGRVEYPPTMVTHTFSPVCSECFAALSVAEIIEYSRTIIETRWQDAPEPERTEIIRNIGLAAKYLKGELAEPPFRAAWQ